MPVIYQSQSKNKQLSQFQQKNYNICLFPMSIEQKYKRLQGLFPQLAKVPLIPITAKMVSKYHGFTFHNSLQGAKVIEEGKLRYQHISPNRIQLNLNLQNALYVLLHQIAHCLSPLVWRKTKKDEWEYREHDRIFYEKLWEVIRVANKQGIYQKEFDNINHLMKYDGSV